MVDSDRYFSEIRDGSQLFSLAFDLLIMFVSGSSSFEGENVVIIIIIIIIMMIIIITCLNRMTISVIKTAINMGPDVVL